MINTSIARVRRPEKCFFGIGIPFSASNFRTNRRINPQRNTPRHRSLGHSGGCCKRALGHIVLFREATVKTKTLADASNSFVQLSRSPEPYSLDRTELRSIDEISRLRSLIRSLWRADE